MSDELYSKICDGVENMDPVILNSHEVSDIHMNEIFGGYDFDSSSSKKELDNIVKIVKKYGIRRALEKYGDDEKTFTLSEVDDEIRKEFVKYMEECAIEYYKKGKFIVVEYPDDRGNTTFKIHHMTEKLVDAIEFVKKLKGDNICLKNEDEYVSVDDVLLKYKQPRYCETICIVRIPDSQ